MNKERETSQSGCTLSWDCKSTVHSYGCPVGGYGGFWQPNPPTTSMPQTLRRENVVK